MTVSTNVPNPFDVAINGHDYILDDKNEAFLQGRQTIPLLRSQSDTGNLPGEGSINPEDLWRRSQRSWHRGAGQKFLDRDDSDPARFNKSIGVDVWTRDELKVLPRTQQIASHGFSVSTGNKVAAAVLEDRAYAVGHNALKRSNANDVHTWSSMTSSIDSSHHGIGLATDGSTLYVAIENEGIETIDNSTSTTSAFATGSIDGIGYAKGRLIASFEHELFNITAGGAFPTAMFTHPNTDFRWVGFAEGPGYIYAAGYAGGKSVIYKTAVEQDGTALEIPIQAGELPEGERIYSIVGYLGFIVVGIGTGFRLATADANGNLTFGALVDIGEAVRCFEPQDRFIYFGWNHYDDILPGGGITGYSGLGRMDLTQLTAPNVPAYATDIMYSYAGSPPDDVWAVGTLDGNQFIVADGYFYGRFESGGNVYAFEGARLYSGQLEYGIPERKIAQRIDVKHGALGVTESIGVYVSSDNATEASVGSITGTNQVDSLDFEVAGYVHEVSFRFVNPSIVLANTSLGLSRYDFKVFPTSERGQVVMVPVLLYDELEVDGAMVRCNPYDEFLYLHSLKDDGLIDFQELGITEKAMLEDIQFQRHKRSNDSRFWNGTAVCRLKVFP